MDIFGPPTYLPRLVNVVCERPLTKTNKLSNPLIEKMEKLSWQVQELEQFRYMNFKLRHQKILKSLFKNKQNDKWLSEGTQRPVPITTLILSLKKCRVVL